MRFLSTLVYVGAALIGITTGVQALIYDLPIEFAFVATFSGFFTYFICLLLYFDKLSKERAVFEKYWDVNKALLKSRSPYLITKKVFDDVSST